MSRHILVINPGSTSTKIGVFEEEQLLFDVTLRHSAEELAPYATIADQKDFRKELVLSALREVAEAGTAVLLVTHENEAEKYADEIFRMDAGRLTRAE